MSHENPGLYCLRLILVQIELRLLAVHSDEHLIAAFSISPPRASLVRARAAAFWGTRSHAEAAQLRCYTLALSAAGVGFRYSTAFRSRHLRARASTADDDRYFRCVFPRPRLPDQGVHVHELMATPSCVTAAISVGVPAEEARSWWLALRSTAMNHQRCRGTVTHHQDYRCLRAGEEACAVFSLAVDNTRETSWTLIR